MMNPSRNTLLTLLIAVLPAPALAQTTPDAGALQQQIERERQQQLPKRVAPAKSAAPAAMAPLSGVVVTVKQFRFAGNTLLSAEQLAPAVADYLNRPLDFAQLQAAAAAIATLYRSAGWVVNAYLPQQDIEPPPFEKPLTFWLTGLSGSGKTTLATALAEALALMALPSQLVDGDTLRQQQSAGLGYSRDHRRANVLRATELCRSINDSGEIAIAALISPFRADRELARDLIGAGRFLEIHVATPLIVCEQRDPKGLYRKARRGEIKEFTGISHPYEVPLTPHLALDTSRIALAECVNQLTALLDLEFA